MTDEQKELIVKTVCDAISDIVSGPRGDPEECNLIAAENLYDLIDKLGLEDTAKRVVRRYTEKRNDFESRGDDNDDDI